MQIMFFGQIHPFYYSFSFPPFQQFLTDFAILSSYIKKYFDHTHFCPLPSPSPSLGCPPLNSPCSIVLSFIFKAQTLHLRKNISCQFKVISPTLVPSLLHHLSLSILNPSFCRLFSKHLLLFSTLKIPLFSPPYTLSAPLPLTSFLRRLITLKVISISFPSFHSLSKQF